MTNPQDIAEKYYTAMGEKNIDKMGHYLHSEVEFKAPIRSLKGKESVLTAAKQLVAAFDSLNIRSKFSSGDQAVLIIDLDFPDPIGRLPTAALLQVEKDLIVKIELFFDPTPLIKKS